MSLSEQNVMAMHPIGVKSRYFTKSKKNVNLLVAQREKSGDYQVHGDSSSEHHGFRSNPSNSFSYISDRTEAIHRAAASTAKKINKPHLLNVKCFFSSFLFYQYCIFPNDTFYFKTFHGSGASAHRAPPASQQAQRELAPLARQLQVATTARFLLLFSPSEEDLEKSTTWPGKRSINESAATANTGSSLRRVWFGISSLLLVGASWLNLGAVGGEDWPRRRGEFLNSFIRFVQSRWEKWHT